MLRVFYYGVATIDKSTKTIVKSYDEAKSLYAETIVKDIKLL